MTAVIAGVNHALEDLTMRIEVRFDASNFNAAMRKFERDVKQAVERELRAINSRQFHNRQAFERELRRLGFK